jgi:hypothetical protein
LPARRSSTSNSLADPVGQRGQVQILGAQVGERAQRADLGRQLGEPVVTEVDDVELAQLLHLRRELCQPIVGDVEHPQPGVETFDWQRLEAPPAEDQALSAGNDVDG